MRIPNIVLCIAEKQGSVRIPGHSASIVLADTEP